MDKIYIQTYSVIRDYMQDFRGTMKRIAETGYDGVEFAAGYGGLNAHELKAFLDEIGLKAISTHVGLDNAEENIDIMAEIGAQYLICPGAHMPDLASTLEVAKRLNEIGAKAKACGLKFGYHNHTQEFAKIGDRYLLEIIMDLTDPDLVKFQIDVGWATCAGIDVPAFLIKHAGRICSIHVKETDTVTGVEKPLDWASFPKDENGRPILPKEIIEERERIAATDCPTGKGIIDWVNIKKLADQAGAGSYVIEREWDYKGDDIFGCVKEDVESLRKILE